MRQIRDGDRISVADLKKMGGLAALQRGKGLPRRDLRLCADGKPSERQEQVSFANYLDELHELTGLLWNHNPNGGARSPGEGGKLKAEGVKPGVPDNYIYDDVPIYPGQYRGVAIELKREFGGIVSDDQEYWLEELTARGWFCRVCNGEKEAIALVQSLGYDPRIEPGLTLDQGKNVE